MTFYPHFGNAPVQIQKIASFLAVYDHTPEVLEELGKGNSEPFQYAMMKAQSFAKAADVEAFAIIFDNIKPSSVGRQTTGQDPLELKNFGMVFGDSFIKESGLEGEKTSDVYVKLAAEYFEAKGLDKSPESKALYHTLKNRIILDRLDSSSEVQKKIKDQLAKSIETPKKCILLGGWMQHALVYEIEQQENGKLIFRIYNEGEGIQYHDQIQDKYKTKYAGCIGIMDIPEELLFKPSFIACLQSVSKLSGSVHDTKPIEFLVGHLLPMLDGAKEIGANRAEQFMSPQKSGTCTYRSVLAFLAHSMPTKDYKNFKLDFKIYMLDRYLPQLKQIANETVTADNYEQRLLELSTIRRSIEKFAAGINKLQNNTSPEKIEEARNKISLYQAELSKLERGILKYEKEELYSDALTDKISTTTVAEFNSLCVTAKKDSDSESTKFPNKLPDCQKTWSACAEIVQAINDIPTDHSSTEFNAKVEKCIEHFDKLLTDTKLSEDERILLATNFFQKMGNIGAWDNIKFTDPISVQKQLKHLTEVFGKNIQQSNIDIRAERVCIYLSFCYALEQATKQLPKNLRIIDMPDGSIITTYRNQTLLKSLQTSDPFWVNYIQGMTQLKGTGHHLMLFSTGGLSADSAVLSSSSAKQISSWWSQELADNAPLRNIMQKSIESDRLEQSNRCKAIEEKYERLKVELPAECKTLEEEISSLEKECRETLWKKQTVQERDIKQLILNQTKADLERTKNKIKTLGMDKQNELIAVEKDNKYWPKGFENSPGFGKEVDFKGSFLFLHNPDFIKSKFGNIDVNALKLEFPDNPEEVQRVTDIIERGDLLTKEFRTFIDCSLICQEVSNKKIQDAIISAHFSNVSFTFDSEEPLLLHFPARDIFYNSSPRSLVADDIYHSNLRNPALKNLYGHIQVKTVYSDEPLSETSEPEMVQSFFRYLEKQKAARDLSHDTVRELFSLRVEKNIRIDALLNYFQENVQDLADPSWFSMFYSYMFESNLLLKELENPKTREIILPKLEKFFKDAIDNAIGLEQFDMAANMFWMAANVQKYIDFVTDKEGKPRLKPIINKKLVFQIIDKVSNEKYKSQRAVVFEAVLASCSHLVKSPIDIDDPDAAFIKKLVGYAWTSHIIRQKSQINEQCQPRKEDADRFTLSLNRFLGEATSPVLQKDVLEIVNNTVAPTLSCLYPNLGDLNFEASDDQQDVFKAADGTTISLISGGLSPASANLLKIYDQPVPDKVVKYLKGNKIYPNEEDIDQLRCYMDGTIVYIKDKKNGIELKFYDGTLFVKFPWCNDYFMQFIKSSEKFQSNNYELNKKFHHFSAYPATYLCDPVTFKPIYRFEDNTMYKCDENGKLNTDAKLVKLSTNETLFSTFEDPQCTLCWRDSKDQLTAIEFPRLKCSFNRTSDGRWGLSQQKGWYLANEQYAPHFGQKTGFLVLENDKTKEKKVIFPVWPIIEITKRSLDFPVSYEFNGETMREGHYVECTVKGSELIPNSLEARFYLAHIFLEKGRLDEAEKLLFAHEADPSHKAFSVNEKKVLETIIYSKKSKDIGSRTLRIQARALYLLKRDQVQFPSEPQEVIRKEAKEAKEKNDKKLMEDYVKRLGHIKPLDVREELLILKSMTPPLSTVLSARMLEIGTKPENQGIEEIQRKASTEVVEIQRETISEAYTTLKTNWGLNIPYPVLIPPLTWKERYTYKFCRMKNTFPFDPKEPDINVLKRYLPLLAEECEKYGTDKWGVICKNGLAQTLHALLLYSTLADTPLYDSYMYMSAKLSDYIISLISKIRPVLPTASKTAKSSMVTIEGGVKKSDASGIISKDMKSLVVLREVRAPENANDFLPGLARDYLEPKEAQAFHVSEVLFDGSSPELVDETSRQQFEYCRDEIRVAQAQRKDLNYRLKDVNVKDYKGGYDELKIELDKSIAEQSRTLAIQERVILDALSSALCSDHLSELSFISKRRELPSIQEICVLCAKKDDDKCLKERFPELSETSLKHLKDAAKNYLVEKQFLLHLQQASSMTEDVRNAPSGTEQEREAKGMLEDALGKTLVSKREYDLDDPNAMVFLQLETVQEIKFRADQIKNIREFIKATEQGKEIVLQMIMGAGKTSVLQPLLGFLLAKPGQLSTTIVPNALFEPVKDSLSKIFGRAFQRHVTTMNYDRDLANNNAYLKTFLGTIKDAAARGSVFLLEPRQKQSIITSLKGVYAELAESQDDPNLEERLDTIMEICHFLHLHEVDQMDESDLVLNPQVIFKYPIGTRTVFSLEKASILSDILLSLASDDDISNNVSLDFINAFRTRRGDKISAEAVSFNPDLLKDVIQPKLAEKAIKHLIEKSPTIKKIFADESTKNLAELYFRYFLTNTSPFDEEIQAHCLLAEETEIYNNLIGKSPDELDILAEQTPKTAESLIAKKIIYQNKIKKWIEDMVPAQSDRDLLGACGIAITLVLPTSLNKSCGAEYGKDPNESASISRPYYASESPKPTKFGTPEEDVIYTTQQVLFYGIPETEAGQILEGLIKQAKKEMVASHIPLIETAAYKIVEDVFDGNLSNFSFMESLQSEKFKEFIKAFQQKASKNEKIIRIYLEGYVYTKITEHDKSLSCTPQALGGSSKCQSGYTGTLHEGILTRTQEAMPEKGTNGRIISAVQSKMDKGIAVTEVFPTSADKSPTTMMIDRFKADKDLFVFIDSGGWLKEEQIDKYAAKMLTECRTTRPDLEGIVYHNKDGSISCLELDLTTNEFIKKPIADSRLKTSDGKVLTIIGQKYETGTNILQKANAKAFMSIRKGMTMRDGLQSMFRMRQILVNQSVSFALTSDVSDSIATGVLDGLFLNKEFKNLFNKGGEISEADIIKALPPELNDVLKRTIVESFKTLNERMKAGKLKNITPRILITEFSGIFKKEFGVDSGSVWRYFAVNQAHAEQEKNWLAAKQKMKEVIEKPIRMALFDKTLSKTERIEIFSKFSDLLIETTEKSQFKKFTSGGRHVDSQTAIDEEIEYYKKLFERLKGMDTIGSRKIIANMENLYNNTIDRFKADKDLFVFIDSGGLLEGEQIDKYAAKMLIESRTTRPDLEGIVYHNEEGSITYLELDLTTNEFVKKPIEESRLKTADGKVLTIIGKKYETDTNIPQKPNAKVFRSIRLDACITATLEGCVKINDIPKLIFTGDVDQNQELELEQEEEVELEVELEVEVEDEVEEEMEVEEARETLSKKNYVPLASNVLGSAVLDVSKFFEQAVQEQTSSIGSMASIVPARLTGIFGNLDFIKYSKNLFIDGAQLGTSTHGQYHLPGRYLLVISDPANPNSPTYMLVSHQDAGKIKNGIVNQSKITPPKALSLVTFDGSISACTNHEVAADIVKQERFKEIAVAAKIFAGKISYTSDEIAIIKKMLDKTGNSQQSAKELSELLNSILKYLPRAAKLYGSSSIRKMLESKISGEPIAKKTKPLTLRESLLQFKTEIAPHVQPNVQPIIASVIDGKDITTEQKNQLFIWACEGNHEHVVKALITGKVDITNTEGDDFGKTPLHYASGKKVVAVLIKAGADPNAKDKDGKTPLHYARSKEVVEALIKAGADQNAKDKDGRTPLHYASSKEVVEALIKTMADSNAKDRDGKTPLHYAHSNEVVEALIKAKAKVDEKDRLGKTPLHCASNKEVVAALVRAKANVNAQSNVRKTPLHYANNEEVYRALIMAGSDPQIKDQYGEVPKVPKAPKKISG